MSDISNMAYVDSTAQIGENVIIEPFAYIGKDAIIEDNVVIKANARVEHATINRASGEGNNTIVGDRCLLMTGSHVAHNCILGDEVIFANLVTIAPSGKSLFGYIAS